ncbi:S49 family peptidase [Candidatus Protochlamydia phocaeensis]|uniref:S49 family peptidase n=1 Tax=Candidatus Protochlamydia phocaeensis TaxID=1414722 RepID=UPI0008380741|nr:S49 family peptidase [Candidatus Protochlamydia phocaeensis]
MRESILYSSVRSFMVAFCAMLGIFIALFVIIILFAALSTGTNEDKLTTVNTQEILPNAEGKREVLSSEAPVILQINIDGIIGTEELSAKTIRQQLIESREGDFKNNRVKGVLLYIDSPGGTVTDANGIYNALMEYKQKYKVPVYAYVDGLCASGGMYIALAADKIYASDVSLIGSIGVIAPTFMNLTKLLEKIGVETLTISAGKDKDALNPLRPWKPGEDENYRQVIDYYYQQFVQLVTANRPEISKDKLVKDYGAHIFPAAEAQKYGYIDVSDAHIKDALTGLLKEVGIEGNYYQVIRFENKGWWKNLFSNQASLLTGKVKHEVSVSPTVDLLLQNRFLYLYYPQ